MQQSFIMQLFLITALALTPLNLEAFTDTTQQDSGAAQNKTIFQRLVTRLQQFDAEVRTALTRNKPTAKEALTAGGVVGTIAVGAVVLNVMVKRRNSLTIRTHAITTVKNNSLYDIKFIDRAAWINKSTTIPADESAAVNLYSNGKNIPFSSDEEKLVDSMTKEAQWEMQFTGADRQTHKAYLHINAAGKISPVQIVNAGALPADLAGHTVEQRPSTSVTLFLAGENVAIKASEDSPRGRSPRFKLACIIGNSKDSKRWGAFNGEFDKGLPAEYELEISDASPDLRSSDSSSSSSNSMEK